MEKSSENYRTICRMVNHYEDLLICLEDESDRKYLETELSFWENKKDSQDLGI